MCTRACVCSPPFFFPHTKPFSPDLHRDIALPPSLPLLFFSSIRHSVCSLNSVTNDSGGGIAAPAADPPTATHPPPRQTEG